MRLRFLQGQTPADDAVAFGDVKADDFIRHWSGRWWVLENPSMEWGSVATPMGESIAQHGAELIPGDWAHGSALRRLWLRPVHRRRDPLAVRPQGGTGFKIRSVGGQVCHGRWFG